MKLHGIHHKIQHQNSPQESPQDPPGDSPPPPQLGPSHSASSPQARTPGLRVFQARVARCVKGHQVLSAGAGDFHPNQQVIFTSPYVAVGQYESTIQPMVN